LQFAYATLAFAAEQTVPQLPQLFTLVLVLVSQVLLASQSANGAVQEEKPHTPATQFGVPPVAGHTLPHVLQLLTSEAVLISQPLP
jgi:hypothetical protein